MAKQSHLGVSTPQLFLTNVVVIYVGKANAMAFMQLLQHAVHTRNPTALSADDTHPATPVFFFDVPFSDVRVMRAGAVDSPNSSDRSAQAAHAEQAVRASVFGIKGMTNPHLPALLAIGHAFVIVSEGDAPPLLATRTIAEKLDEQRRDQVYPALVNDDEDAHAVLCTVIADIARKASS